MGSAGPGTRGERQPATRENCRMSRSCRRLPRIAGSSRRDWSRNRESDRPLVGLDLGTVSAVKRLALGFLVALELAVAMPGIAQDRPWEPRCLSSITTSCSGNTWCPPSDHRASWAPRSSALSSSGRASLRSGAGGLGILEAVALSIRVGGCREHDEVRRCPAAASGPVVHPLPVCRLRAAAAARAHVALHGPDAKWTPRILDGDRGRPGRGGVRPGQYVVSQPARRPAVRPDRRLVWWRK